MVHSYLQDYQAKMVELCRKHAVKRLYAFGSVTSTEFDEAQSDVDLLMELPDDMLPEQKGETYFQLLSAFEALFGRKVDLLLNQPFRNPYFARAVETSKELLYTA